MIALQCAAWNRVRVGGKVTRPNKRQSTVHLNLCWLLQSSPSFWSV